MVQSKIQCALRKITFSLYCFEQHVVNCKNNKCVSLSCWCIIYTVNILIELHNTLVYRIGYTWNMEQNNLYRTLSDNVCRLIHGPAQTRHRGGWERLGLSTGGHNIEQYWTILNNIEPYNLWHFCASAFKIHFGEYNVIRKCELIEV